MGMRVRLQSYLRGELPHLESTYFFWMKNKSAGQGGVPKQPGSLCEAVLCPSQLPS